MSEGGWGRVWDKWLGDAALLLFTGAAGYLGQWAGRESGATQGWLSIGTAVCGLGAAGVKVAQTRREKTVRSAREAAEQDERRAAREQYARDLVTFGSALKPGIEHLAKLAIARKSGKEREALYAAIRNRVVDAASTLTGGAEQVRAVFFRRDDIGGVPTLVQSEYAGAREPSRRVFRDHQDDPAGQEAWAALHVGKVVTWPNVSKSAPRGWDASTQSRAYMTFTMAPVLGPDRQIYGMLNVDALEADSLGRLDEERLAAFAALLGAAAHVVMGDQ